MKPTVGEGFPAFCSLRIIVREREFHESGRNEYDIARHWRGWTKTEDADGYEDFLKRKVLPELQSIDGYRGGYVRSEGADETEFVVINFFNSLDAVKSLAGQTTPFPFRAGSKAPPEPD